MGNRGKVNVEKLNCPNPLIPVAVACSCLKVVVIEIKFAGLVCFREERLNALVVNICSRQIRFEVQATQINLKCQNILVVMTQVQYLSYLVY